MKISPYNTRQEQYRDEPFKMMVICFMLNLTSYKQVDKVRFEFFSKFKSPQDIINARDEDIVSTIKTLGLYNRRTKIFKRFSSQWIQALKEYGSENKIPLSELKKMSGVGKYALDSWKIFQLKEYDINVEDKILKKYLKWKKKN